MQLNIHRTSARALLRLQINEESRPSDDLTPVTTWSRAGTPRSYLTGGIGIELTTRTTLFHLRRS